MNETEYPILTYMLRMGLIKRNVRNEIKAAFEEIDHLKMRLEGMERREVTFRAEIDHRENFIRKLMAELRKHGWGDFHYGSLGNKQDPNIVALLREGYDYEHRFVIMQEGNIYERGSNESGSRPQETGKESANPE